MEYPVEINVASEKETALLAAQFAGDLNCGDVILLNGNLGSGKTFFVKQVCSVLGIDNVTSPSFAIVNEYESGRKIIHFDFYRIKKVAELYDIGIEDYLVGADSIVFVEWAELFPEILPRKNFQVDFKFENESSRKIRIKKNG